MIAYVEPGTLKVGDEVAVELVKGTERIAVMQVSVVKKVEPSKYHTDYPMDEVEF